MSVPKTSPDEAGEEGTSASGDQSSWNMGQDDSAINGKHLPPSPRRQCSTRSLPAPSNKPCQTTADIMHSLMEPPVQPLARELGKSASPPVHLELPSDQKLSPESQVQTEGCSGLRRKVLSKETIRHYQERSQQGGSNRQPSLLIPWEKDNKGNREEMNEEEPVVQDKDLLEEIECRRSAPLNS